VALLLAATPANATEATGQPHCQEVTVPVALADGQPATDRLWGRLCTPAGSQPKAVQVLLHGLTYSHLYWDFPYRPERYSYVDWATRAGYATLNLDRIGIGRSSHPPSGQVTLQSNAFTVHQAVQGLRSGALTGHPYRKVLLAGHSFGAEIAKFEAATYQDVDGLILSGNAHRESPSAFEGRAAELGQPVSEVPHLAALVPPGDDGYLTVREPFRQELMYYLPSADPLVVALDIATRQTVTLGELATIEAARDPAVTGRIRVPILFVNGDRDRLICAADAGNDCSSAAAVVRDEQPNYPNAPVDAFLLADTGHVVNLHRGAPTAYRAAIAWADRHLGPNPQH
jgi:pimeloyl-ACP methyl ester carboxylesterase